MKYYLVQTGEKLEIIKVQPHQEDQFRKEYVGRVKASADSLGELLQQLDKLRL